MPLVRISISPGHDDSASIAIGNGVHDALVTTVNVPEADRFQIITKLRAGEMIWDRSFLDIERSERAIFVEISLAPGRDAPKKRALYARIVENIVRDTNVRPEDVLIVLTETERVNWSFGNGIAQYVPS